MESLDIQRSLTVLEDRFRELREIGEKRYQLWEAERAELQQQLADRAAELKATQLEREEQRKRGEDLLKEREGLQSRVKELEEGYAAQAAELKATQLEREEQRKRGEDLLKEREGLQSRVKELEEGYAAQAAELSDSREEAELTLLQLHQVQEELEQIFLADRNKAAQLAQLRDQLVVQEKQMEAAQKSAAESQQQHQNATEEAELTLLQLHQVQEELEHYFLQSRAADDLAQAQHQQLSRAQELVGRLLPNVALMEGTLQSAAIEVLHPEALAPAAVSVQTDALLNSYAASLERAAALLQRAMKR